MTEQDNQPPFVPPGAIVLFTLIGLMVLIELILNLADYQLIGTARWRALAYQNAGFWAGLVYDWRPNYFGQPSLMFLTYSFLHGDFLHMATNMVTLAALGLVALHRVGTNGFAAIYVTSAISGAVAFALLTNSSQPMVGASGALFGLVAAWLIWDARDRMRTRRGIGLIAVYVLGLVLLNLVMWLWLEGQLAWETHLGGALGGAFVTWLRPRGG